MSDKDFSCYVSELGISLNDHQLSQLRRFYHLVLEWNEKINLTTITLENEFYLKHFYDSLTLYKCVNLNQPLTLCDIGSGAGFPGIVLKIVFPDLNITLIDSLRKRVDYLNCIIHQLDLKNISAIHTRAEDYAKIHREEFDIVTARAVTSLTKLINFSLPMIKVNKGIFIAMKGKKNQEEFMQAREILHDINAEIVNVQEFLLPIEGSERTLISIKKRQKTTKSFPKPLKTFDKL